MTNTIRFYLSGGERNSDPKQSLGGPISQTEATDLFGDIGPDDAATGLVELRCVYVLVADGGPVEYPRIWFTDVPQRTVMEVGIDPSGKNGVARAVSPGESPNIVFSRPLDYLTGLGLPDEPYHEGDRVALWLRRISPSGAKSGREAFNLRVRGLTTQE